MYHKDRISIIGAGTLGSTIAYSLSLCKIAKEILLVDMSQKIVHGQVLDLSEADFSDTTIRAGTFKEAGQSALVIVTADTPDTNHTRQDWMAHSRHMMFGIASSISPVHASTMFLVVAEPVDLFVQCLQTYFPHVSHNHIFGLGTTMATRRFASWLADMMPPNNPVVAVTDAYCIGSREMPVVVWNHAKINGIAVPSLSSVMSQRSVLETLVTDHRTHLICERKGAACYGIAAYVTRIVQDLVVPPNKPCPWVLSVYVPHYNSCFSWPVLLGSSGIEHIIDLPLSAEEQAQVAQVVASNAFDFH